MPETRKVLGQKSHVAGVLETVYTVGPSAQAVVSTIVVCNTGATESVWRLSVAVGGAADSIEQHIYSGLPLQGYDTFSMTEGYTLNAGDEVRCLSSEAGLAFSVFGVEITP